MKLNKTILMIGANMLATAVHAQNYSINWFTIDGGGGTSSGGIFSVSGTIGQPDSGPLMAGGNFSLAGGFWSIIAVQTPGAPVLTVRLVSPDTLVVSWPSPSTGYSLEQNSTLNPAGWGSPSEKLSDDGVTKSITVSPIIGNRYYRLYKAP